MVEGKLSKLARRRASKDSSSSDSADSTYSSQDSYDENYDDDDDQYGDYDGQQLVPQNPNRICISSYHDRKNPELRTFAAAYVFICLSVQCNSISELHGLTESELQFYFNKSKKSSSLLEYVLIVDSVITSLIGILAFVFSFGVSKKNALLSMSNKRIKMTPTKILLNRWLRPFTVWIIPSVISTAIDALTLALFPFYGSDGLEDRISANSQVMLDVKCCGVHGGEIDYQGRQQPAECVKAASIIGCKGVVEWRTRTVRLLPIFFALKIFMLFFLTWYLLGGIVGDPTDYNGYDFCVHRRQPRPEKRAAEKEERADDDDDSVAKVLWSGVREQLGFFIFFALKIFTLFFLTWYFLGGIVGDPTDYNGYDFCVHRRQPRPEKRAAEKEERADDDDDSV